MLRLICVLILMMVIAFPSLAQQSLVGTYKLVSFQREIDGKPDPSPAEGVRGYITFTSKVYISFQTEGMRKYGPSAADKAALWESMAANAGSYRVEGKKLVRIPDIHSNESSVGKPVTCDWEIKGNRLILTDDPRPLARDPSKKMVGRREYERID